MSRQDRFSWFSAQQPKQRRKKRPSHASARGLALSRRLHIEPLEDRRMLAVITVDSLADNMVVDGSITLREAIQAANTDASVDGSVAGSGADTIDFSAALSGLTITLGGSELEITETLTIDATALAAGVTIDADELSRIFNITATTGDFAIAGLTLTGGKTTGDNFSSFDTTFSGGAVRSLTTGDLSIVQSTIFGNSTIGNEAGGGGFFSYGTVTLTNSTISGNSTTGSLANGGGFYSKDYATLTSSTVTDNHAYGSNTYGGGAWSIGGANITNSILAGNTTGGGNPDLSDLGSSASFSLIGDTSGTTISAGFGNIINQDPLLGPLANNGGSTQTHALLPFSPAINTGDFAFTSPPDFDQRGVGFPRVSLGRIDLGATEFQATFPVQGLIVDSASDIFDGDYTIGNLTLREAVFLANVAPAVDTITFDSGLSSQTITLAGTELPLTDAVTIDATSLAENVTIDANGLSRIFNITATTGDFTLAGLTLIGGSTTGDNDVFPDSTFSGGAVRSLTTGSFTIEQSTVSGNSTAGKEATGGGIFAVSAVTLTSSTVSGNSTAGDGAHGGGIHSPSAVTLTNSTISENSTVGSNANGGGIFSSSTVALSNSTITGNNTAGFGGGGIFSYGDVTVTNSTVTDNHTPLYSGTGGGIWIRDDTLSIEHSIVAGNTAGGGSPDIEPSTAAVSLQVEFSIIGDNEGTGLTGFQTPEIFGNLIGSAAGAGIIDPLLGPLADNGGSTETHALLPFSPAINAGDPLFLMTPIFDQRGTGFPRISFDRVDIGAFEFQTTLPVQGLVVDTATDVYDGDFTIGNLALREAVFLANIDAMTNTITFDTSLSGQTITLGGTELPLSEAVTIDAAPLAQNLTIDANELSRIFNITATTGDFTLAGLTLTGGRTTGDNASSQDSTHNGGAVRSLTTGNLTIDQSTVSGSGTTGAYLAPGGGIFSAGAVTLTNSTVSGNSTTGVDSNGGGIFSDSAVTLINSTLSGNNTTGEFARGGGIYSYDAVTLTNSTITDNHANGSNAIGGGIRNSNGVITITHSILAGNTTGGGSPDIDPGLGIFSADFSLLGTAVTPDAGGTGNLFDDTPLLDVLADNGGPTQTHALLAGSPAIDAGDPAIVAPPANDQRGALFMRQNGTIDIGAFEIQPQSLIVDTLVDENDGDYSSGDLSLREAIDIANAVPMTDAITFAAALDGGTITLGGTDLEITESLTIDATALAQNVTIDANSASRIFNITATSGDFILAGLTLIGGRTTGDNVSFPVDSTFNGGAIRSLTTGNLTVDQSTISGSNTTGDRANGGGVFSSGAVVFTSSTISGNSAAGLSASGGGIFSTGPVTLTSSTVSGNSTSGTGAAGGGILSLDDVTLETSTVSDNSTTGIVAFGGGIHSLGVTTLTNSTISGNSTAGNQSFGGGISGSAVTLNSSTVSGNSTTGVYSDGGGISTGGALTLSNSTVTDNHANYFNSTGGGIWNSTTATITITHSILAGNTAGGFGPDIDPGTGIFAADFSLLGTTVSPDAGGSGNLFDDNPQLGPLADNGGPTETQRLLFGSPAIDAGDPVIVAPPAFDQRGVGFPRQHGTIDIGAFEGQGLLLIVDTLVDENDSDTTLGDLSLREAIDIANGFAGGDTITFAAALDGDTINLLQALGELTITDEVTIDASSLAAGLTIDAGDGTDGVFNTKDGFRIFNINDGMGADIPVQLVNLTLTGGDLQGSNGSGGGAIDTQEDLTLTSVTIVGNSGFAGGGIRARFGTLTLFSSTISGNAANRGGGIYASGETTIINQSTISDNSTGGSSSPGAGGIRSNSGSLTITSSTISGNMAMGTGGSSGGISLTTSPLILTTSTVSDNSAGRDGGGIVAANSDVTITSSTISGNTADIDGGGIVIHKLLTITSSTITGNRADNDNNGFGVGGGIVNKSTLDSLLLSHTLIAGNDLGNGSQDDISSNIPVDATSEFNFIGVDTGFTGITDGSAGNQIGTSGAPIDPLLGPLADNGGPTETHTLLAGSPAIDSGDPSILFNPAEFDQRGTSFVRVANARIDIGAHEVQVAANSADFDGDGDIDGTDFLAWQRGFGTLNANKPDGDADNDTVVDGVDLGIWESQFGLSAPVAAATASLASEPIAATNLVDAVMAMELARGGLVAESPLLEEVPAFAIALTDHDFAVESITSAVVLADEAERPDTDSSEDAEDETPWLVDELLGRIFG